MQTATMPTEIKNNPPLIHHDKTVVLKKAGDDVHMDELEKWFNEISYQLHDIGCDYRAIINHRGKRTVFQLIPDGTGNVRLEVGNEEAVFGKSFSGCVYASLKKCQIRTTHGGLSINSGNNQELFISFYNHDKHPSEREQFIDSLPKDYQIRLLCDRCDHIVNETELMSAYSIWSDWTMLVMGRGLVTPACKKCSNTTYDDLNISNELKIYRLATNRPVSFETIKKEAEPLSYKISKMSDKRKR